MPDTTPDPRGPDPDFRRRTCLHCLRDDCRHLPPPKENTMSDRPKTPMSWPEATSLIALLAAFCFIVWLIAS